MDGNDGPVVWSTCSRCHPRATRLLDHLVNRSAAPLDQLGQPPMLTVANLAELADVARRDRF